MKRHFDSLTTTTINLNPKPYITHTLHETLSSLLGQETEPITLNLHLNDPTHLDNIQSCKDPYYSIP